MLSVPQVQLTGVIGDMMRRVRQINEENRKEIRQVERETKELIHLN